MMKIKKNNKIIVFQLIITGFLFWWLSSQLDIKEFSQVIHQTQLWPILGLSVLLQTLAFGLGGLRWLILLKAHQVPCNYWEVLSSYYLGVFFNNFLPTSMGGDLIRTWHLHLAGYALEPLIATSILDRIIGLIVVLTLGAVALPFWDPPFLEDWMHWIPIMLTMVTLAFFYLVLYLLDTRLAHYESLFDRPFLRVLFQVLQICCATHRSKGALLITVILTLLLQSLVVFVYSLLGEYIGIAIPLPVYFISSLAVFIVATLPISLGGLGVREGTLVGVLVFAGAEVHQATVLSLLYLAVLWAATLPGGCIFLITRFQRAVPENSPSSQPGLTKKVTTR
ncbi:MAG: glycosyltransferase 2 family protein [Pseudomonadota bacterium]|nr:glycosyltransferase 2 family protein [Pseudomonadota bacterium]